MAAIRAAGYDDGELLEIKQVTANFAYANRTVLDLCCSTDGDILGLSPSLSDDPDNWFYNPRRWHSALDGKSPLRFERRAA